MLEFVLFEVGGYTAQKMRFSIKGFLHFLCSATKARFRPCQISMKKHFDKIVNDYYIRDG